MKKTYFILISLLVVSAMVGCSKDEDQLDNRLVGTKWQAADPYYGLIYGGTCYHVIEFVSESEVDYYYTRNGSVDRFLGTYNYVLTYPKVEINGGKYTLTNSRTLSSDGASSSDIYAIHFKQ